MSSPPRFVPAGWGELLQPHVHDEAEPEGLQEMEDEAILAVQDSQQNEVPVNEVEERSYIEGQTVPPGLQPQNPLVGGAEEARCHSPGKAAAALHLLAGEGVGVAQVLLQVEENRV